MMKHVPKGKLILIGGGEDMGIRHDVKIAGRTTYFKPMEILKELLPRKRTTHHIEVITTATSDPEKTARHYRTAFGRIGFKQVGFIHMGNNPETDTPSYVKRVQQAHAVFFSGGDQYKLSVLLGNSDVLTAVQEKYIEDRHFTVAGTSAGAMALPTLMMFEGENNEAILKGTVKISSGLGFLDGCVIDTHFTKRGRFGRLSQAVVMNPTCVGMGIGEDTALVVRRGRDAKCIGSGMVIIIDGKDIRHTNMAFAENNEPVCIENLRVDILCHGNGFNFETRKFIPSLKVIKEENGKR